MHKSDGLAVYLLHILLSIIHPKKFGLSTEFQAEIFKISGSSAYCINISVCSYEN